MPHPASKRVAERASDIYIKDRKVRFIFMEGVNRLCDPTISDISRYTT